MKDYIVIATCFVNGLAKCFLPAGTSKTIFLMFAFITYLVAIGGCAEPLSPHTDHPVSQFSVYFNNDALADGNMVCDAVFPVQRTSPSTTNVAAAALEALFTGPTAEERFRGYRSLFTIRTTGLLKRLQIKTGTAYIDLHDRSQDLTGATSSCGSAEFFTQVQQTLGQFPNIERIIYAIEGQPGAFYDWMELECNRINDYCDPGPFMSP